MGTKSFAAALVLGAMPVVAAAQMEGPVAGTTLRELQLQIGPMNEGPLLGSDGKPIQILGSDWRPIVIYDTDGRPRPQNWQIPDLFPVPNADADGASTLVANQLRKRLDQYSRPIGPGTASQELYRAVNTTKQGCNGAPSIQCQFADALLGSADRLAAAAAAAPDCERAAARFGEVYTTEKAAGSEAARAFDMACLGSFAPRLDDQGGARPELLANAEVDGILDIVGLLEANGEIICAGLVRPDRKFITARHCMQGQGGVSLKVRFASKKLPPLNVQARRHLPWTQLGVAADWAVLELEPGPALPISASRFSRLRGPGAVSLVGLYRYVQPDVYAQEAVSFERDLRFPRNGFCEAIDELAGCLQLACQTVPGFSGTPIIASRGADGTVEVIGFLSRSEGADTDCRTSVNVRNSTFAVSARAVQGI